MALAAFAAFGLLCYQGYCWLRYGTWPPYSGNNLIEFLGGDVDRIRWVGLHRLIAWLADLPLAMWLVGLGVAVYGLLAMIINDIIEGRAKS